METISMKDNKLRVINSLPAYPVDAHRLTANKGFVTLEFLQYVGGGEAIVVSHIRIKDEHLHLLTKSLNTQAERLQSDAPQPSEHSTSQKASKK
jgi:hypothetical protein